MWKRLNYPFSPWTIEWEALFKLEPIERHLILEACWVFADAVKENLWKIEQTKIVFPDWFFKSYISFVKFNWFEIKLTESEWVILKLIKYLIDNWNWEKCYPYFIWTLLTGKISSAWIYVLLDRLENKWIIKWEWLKIPWEKRLRAVYSIVDWVIL